MKIDITITDASAELLAAIAAATGGVPTLNVRATPDQGVEEQEVEPVEAEPENTPEPVQAEEEEEEEETAGASVLEAWDAQYKRAKSVTIGGQTLKEDDWVRVAATGAEGKLFALYRGRAVVAFEDGSEEGYLAADLEVMEPPASEESDGPEQVVNGELVEATPSDVKSLYIQVSNTVSAQRATELMRNVANGKSLKELSAEELNTAYATLSKELAQFNAE